MKNQQEPTIYIFSSRTDQFAAQKLLAFNGAKKVGEKERWLIRESSAAGMLTVSYYGKERNQAGILKGAYIHRRIVYSNGKWDYKSNVKTELFQPVIAEQLSLNSSEQLLEFLKDNDFISEPGAHIIPAPDDASNAKEYASFTIEEGDCILKNSL